jgi:uncharacterized protein (TIGR03000 family)
MYSVVLATVLSMNTTTPDFGGLFRRDRLACYGGCMGCYGCAGCYGVVDCGCTPSYGAVGGMPMPHMDGGAIPDFGVYGAPMPMMPPMGGPGLGETVAPPMIPSIPGESPAPPLAGAAGGYSVPPNAALIVVTMPPDGKLFANGQPIEGAGSVRVFQTPPLEPGKEYDYEVQISLERGGRKYEPKEVTKKFRAGERVNVEFGEPGPGGATSARFTIRMPAGSSLTVEGRPVSLAAGSTFQTPPLEDGRTYYYLLEVEVWRGGQKETVSRNVSFRAGESVKVDLAAARGR